MQLKNASSPIKVTEFPIVSFVKALQLKNAARPILITELPIVTVFNSLNYWKAPQLSPKLIISPLISKA